MTDEELDAEIIASAAALERLEALLRPYWAKDWALKNKLADLPFVAGASVVDSPLFIGTSKAGRTVTVKRTVQQRDQVAIGERKRLFGELDALTFAESNRALLRELHDAKAQHAHLLRVREQMWKQRAVQLEQARKQADKRQRAGGRFRGLAKEFDFGDD